MIIEKQRNIIILILWYTIPQCKRLCIFSENPIVTCTIFSELKILEWDKKLQTPNNRSSLSFDYGTGGRFWLKTVARDRGKNNQIALSYGWLHILIGFKIPIKDLRYVRLRKMVNSEPSIGMVQTDFF